MKELESKCAEFDIKILNFNNNLMITEEKIRKIDSINFNSKYMDLVNTLAITNSVEKDSIDKLKTKIESSDQEIHALENKLESFKKDLNKEMKKRDEYLILRNNYQQDISKYSKQMSNYESELKTAKEKYDEYDSWWYRLWYPGTVRELTENVEKIKSKMENTQDRLDESKSNFEKYKKLFIYNLIFFKQLCGLCLFKL